MKRSDIHPGMVVRSIDGERLGKVTATEDETFRIEKGLFFPQDSEARYADVQTVADGEIIIVHGRQALRAAAGIGRRRERASDVLELMPDVVEEHPEVRAPIAHREVSPSDVELRATGPEASDVAEFGDAREVELGSEEPRPFDPRRDTVADSEDPLVHR